MEQIIEFYNNWKKNRGFILYLKKSVNWICLIKDNYANSCAVHKFLFGLEEKIANANWKDKIDEFVLYVKQNDKIFKFVHDFYEISVRNDLWESGTQDAES